MKLIHNLREDFKRNKGLYFLSIPIVIWFFIFCYLPMGGVLMAFQDYKLTKGILGSRWVGLKHFVDFFASPYASRAILNTLKLSFLDLIFCFPSSIIFALMLNEVTHKLFKRAAQTISYMPYFISLVVMCGIIIDFTASGGIISRIVASITGTDPQNLLGNPAYFRTIYIVSNIWQGLGYGSIVYVAALSSVDQELYEAARIDGANRWKQMLHITLPGISATIIIMLILKMGSMLAVGSDKILLLYNPATYSTADVISTLVYRKSFEEYNYGYSAAVGLFNSVINTALLLITNRISRKYSETSLF